MNDSKLRDRIAELSEEITQLREQLFCEVNWPVEFKFTKNESKILDLVFKRSPTIVSYDSLFQHLYSGISDPPLDSIIAVFVSRLRKKLKIFDINMEMKRGFGYYLTKNEKEKLITLRDK